MLDSRHPHRAATRLRRSLLTAAVAAGVALGGPVTSASAAEAVLAPGATAAEDMVLLANLPKRGDFSPVSAFNSDMAFQDDYLFAGNYNGFTVYDIKKARKPVEVVQVLCPGSQNDISVHEDILVVSVDSRRSTDDCNSVPVTSTADLQAGRYWEGIRLFDISDPTAPRYIRSVETDCGSHTHTLVPNGDSLLVYVSSYDTNANYAKCQDPHDKISIVEVPLDAPETASVVAEPVLFPDGGNPGSPSTRATKGCHDITAYPEKGIAAGACMGEGVIIDISRPLAPVVTETVRDDENFAFWHSATFSNAADKVIFTDELGGGGAATCNPTVGPERGANGVYTLTDGQLDFASYYKIAREQGSTENCVAHNGNLVPVKGKDVMVQAWYQGGISVVDYTDPAAPRELAWFDRGPLSKDRLILGGSWSAYYYKGYVYSNDIQQGLDVLEIKDPAVANAKSGKYEGDENVQSQTSF